MPRTDTASRFIAAPCEAVYAALVDPAALVMWLPPGGMTASIEHFDARAGGAFRMVLRYADGSGQPGKSTADADIVDARFLELTPPARVVYAVSFVAADPTYAGPMTMTWEMTAVDRGSRVVITADNVPDAISAEDHATGMTSSLDNLARHLER